MQELARPVTVVLVTRDEPAYATARLLYNPRFDAQRKRADAVFQAWSAVEANIARSRSARVQAEVSRHAADLAHTRYRNGAATQLELIQADRDAFSAEAARIQADADLLNARVQLRLAAGVDPFASR